MGIWKVHLTIPRMQRNQSVKVQKQSTTEWKVISTGLYWCQPHHIRKRLLLNENHLTERKANKFAQVCKIWGASEIMKADGTRTTRTPAFWGYPPPPPMPHDYPILLTSLFWIPSPYYWPVDIRSQVKTRWKPKKLEKLEKNWNFRILL